MDSVTLVVKVKQAEGSEPLGPLELAEAAQKMLEAGGFVVEAGQVLVHQKTGLEEGVFSKPGEAPPTVPYQGNAKLKVSQPGYMDVIGNDGTTLCSFDTVEVRRCWQEMNR